MKSAKTLELDKILYKLSERAQSEQGKKRALLLKPENTFERVTRSLKKTEEAFTLSVKYGLPSLLSLIDIDNSLSVASSGGMLSMKELLDAASDLKVIRTVADWFKEAKPEEYKSLFKLSDTLLPNKFLEERIFYCIKSDSEMNDKASDTLYDIRRKISSKQGSIREKLDSIIRSREKAKYLQENIITQRDGRFVVPVKSEYRSEIRGMVHDTSASGQTFFIEPETVVEINNDLKVLYAEEREETIRILKNLTFSLGESARPIKESIEALSKLDVIFAKVRLGSDMLGSIPEINTDKKIYLRNARHPLLDKKAVQPVTVELGTDFDTMVITGPNTGGKTVTLKTIGLFTLMAMCGMMLPCDDLSSIYVYKNVLADIGDEQSIEQSLSTFSAHMKNIVGIIASADGESLVLIDELGSGTDPVEGAALAESILEELRRKGATVAATTHYAELKSYALRTDGVMNASCEFDVKTLQPTYRLLIGTPGRSNAFAISKKLGLSDLIVKRARELVSGDDRRFNEVVASLEGERRKAQSDKAEAERLRVELEKLKTSVDEAKKTAEAEKEKLIEKARKQATAIVDKARLNANLMLNEMEEQKKGFSKQNADSRLKAAKTAANKGLEKITAISDPIEKRTGNYKLPRSIKAGDDVEVIDIDKKGTVLETPKGNEAVLVQVGIFKSRVKQNNLRLLESSKISVEGKKYRNVQSTSRLERTTSSELDIRGMASDEALIEVDRYIADCVLTNTQTVTIIHGKGTGVLRKSVHEFLRRNKNVKSFRLGTFGEGEMGVTVVELK